MLDDRCKDKIMVDHLSRCYGANFIDKVATELGVKHQLNSNWAHNLSTYINGKHVTIHMFHAVPKECLKSDYLISETITSHNNQIELFPEFYGIYHTELNYDYKKIPSKNFNCFINRSCPFRQRWFYLLIREDLLQHSYVSFWSQNFAYSEYSAQSLFDHFFNQGNQMFKVEHDMIRNYIPYKNFNIDLEDAIIDSEKSLVIETFFHLDDQISFTEKTMRALQMPRPWLLYGCPGAVSALRNWGLDVFDDFIDHSYDNEHDTLLRQQMILDQLKNKIHYSAKLLREFETRANRNRGILREWKYEYLNNKEPQIIEQIKKIQ